MMTFFYLLHDVIFKCLPPNCRDFCRTELTLLSPPTGGSAGSRARESRVT